MKNKTSFVATSEFFQISCNGQTVKTVFSLEKTDSMKNIESAKKQIEELKWGVHKNADVQKKFDGLLK